MNDESPRIGHRSTLVQKLAFLERLQELRERHENHNQEVREDLKRALADAGVTIEGKEITEITQFPSSAEIEAARLELQTVMDNLGRDDDYGEGMLEIKLENEVLMMRMWLGFAMPLVPVDDED